MAALGPRRTGGTGLAADSAGLSEFACDLLLEEATRPRLLDLGAESLLVFLRGVNLNPGAEPEDMVSLRVFADARRVISLRLRLLKAVADLLEDLEAGKGPKTASEVVYYLAHYLTDRVDTLISGIADQLDAVEELVEADERASPDQHQLRTLRRRSAGLRRYLAPQRDIYSQLARYKLSWFVEDDADYWNELNNRLTRNLEELELIRERISVLQEAESRRITERMNRTMYLLGIITGFPADELRHRPAGNQCRRHSRGGCTAWVLAGLPADRRGRHLPVVGISSAALALT